MFGQRVYADLATLMPIPTLVRGQQTVSLPVPNSPWLIGVELFVHLGVVPDPGFAAPPFWLPPGRLVALTR